MRNLIKNRPYVLWVLYLPFYLLLFFITEKLVTTNYWVSYCPLDDIIPFCPPFVLFYVLWYPLMVGTGLFLMWKDPRAFIRYMYFVSIGLTTSLIICLLFPNGQDLRPVLTEDDIFTWILRQIYAADTNTNVLPSMHVVGTMAALWAWFDTRIPLRKWVRPALVVLGLLINASTVFVKQHSFLDIVAGLVLSLIVWFVVARLIPAPRESAAQAESKS